jgi:TetR/AcrR family transcriptional repressor of mexCD-oprJ operon
MSANARSQHPRDAIAQRNREAVLDATERLLARREQPSISAVATEAGVSRPTVYAHFPDRRRLLEALVERAVRRAMAAIESAEPHRGHALPALQRLLAASWEQLSRHEEISHASAGELSADAMRRAHEPARAALRTLVERGRREGAFRTDLPTALLVTGCLALIHATADATRTGELEPDAAADALSSLVSDLIVGRADERDRVEAPGRTREHRGLPAQ